MRSAGAGDSVARPEAVLVDVYETLVACDFAVLRRELPAIAGAEPQAWSDAFARVGPDLSRGLVTMTQAYGQILADCGVTPAPALIRELIRKDRELITASARRYSRKDRELITASARRYSDAIGFLQAARSRGIVIALVSNCIENTRPMLSALGVSQLADAVVLSCETGCAKPDARIYRHALAQLGVTASGAVFIDDQPANCAAAAAMGMTALQIARSTAQPLRPAPGTRVIGSLLEAL
jgi:HAD superfamily hydrolase (TIGR01509 family)